MESPKTELTSRIREMRRRHFGPSGRDEFARRLGISPEEYERFERGTLPGGDVLVRMCEVTGEDLQWLLTGLASRATVVISGARGRHQQLLSRIAEALEKRPELANPLEAFVSLLLAEPAGRQPARALPAASRRSIPILSLGELPERLPEGDDDGPGGLALEKSFDAEFEAVACEPSARYSASDAKLTVRTARQADLIQQVELTAELALLGCEFGARLDDDTMSPMFAAGDAVLVGRGAPARTGSPALFRMKNGAGLCRIWLGEDTECVHLGCVADGSHERVARADIAWSLEVLLRVARAA